MAATITYVSPTTGTNVPTAVQMLPLSRVCAAVAFADADTTALVTHNMNIPLNSTPTQHGQSNGSPMIHWRLSSTSLGTLAPVVTFTIGTNTVTLTKVSAVGSNCTVHMDILRYEPSL